MNRENTGFEEYDTPKFEEPADGSSKWRMEEHLRFCLDGDVSSELWGEHGLIAATMREIYQYRNLPSRRYTCTNCGSKGRRSNAVEERLRPPICPACEKQEVKRGCYFD